MAGIGRNEYIFRILKLYPKFFKDHTHLGDGFFYYENELLHSDYDYVSIIVHLCHPKKTLGEFKRLAPMAGSQCPSFWSEEDKYNHLYNSLTQAKFIESMYFVEWSNDLKRYYCKGCGMETNKKLTMAIMLKEKVKV